MALHKSDARYPYKNWIFTHLMLSFVKKWHATWKRNKCWCHFLKKKINLICPSFFMLFELHRPMVFWHMVFYANSDKCILLMRSYTYQVDNQIISVNSKSAVTNKTRNKIYLFTFVWIPHGPHLGITWTPHEDHEFIFQAERQYLQILNKTDTVVIFNFRVIKDLK